MRRYTRAIPVLLTLLVLIIPVIPTTAAEVAYDITYDDPAGDIEALTRAGAELGDIDIRQLSSTLEQSLLTQEDQIILRLRVQGSISALDTSGYVVQMESDEEFYVFEYAAGVCTEIYSGEAYVATGAGSDTLEIIVPLDKIHAPETHFDISSFTAHNSADGLTYMDLCPDDTLIFTPKRESTKPVEILEPTDGAAVYGIADVQGMTHNTQENPDIKYVEYQIDAKDSDGWVKASSYDGFLTWHFDWDTTEYTDEKHTLNIRAKNSSGHFSTQAVYWVDQSMATSPKTAPMPEVRVGDMYWYEGDGDIEFAGIQAVIHTQHNVTLWGAGTIESGGRDHDVFIYKTVTLVDIDAMGIKITSRAEGFIYQQRSDLSTVMVDQWVNSTIPLQPPSNIHTVAEYDPPLDSMNFPMTVGERWFSETTMTTATTNQGETTSESVYVNGEYECLRPQDVTVPAGTFETLVKRSENTSGGEGETGFSGIDTSSFTDGWSLSYYAPEIGYPVKEETYDSDGNLMNNMDLVDYRRGTGAMVVVLNITAGPEPTVGKDSWISVLLKNTGIQPAVGVQIYINDSEVNLFSDFVNLEAQDTLLVNISWPPSDDGSHLITATTPDHEGKRNFDVDPGDGKTAFDAWWLFPLIALLLLAVLIVIVVVVVKMKKPEEAMVLEVEGEEEEQQPPPKKKKGGKKSKNPKIIYDD